MRSGSDELRLLSGLAVSLAERFVPLLTAIAEGTPPTTRVLPPQQQRNASATGAEAAATAAAGAGDKTPSPTAALAKATAGAAAAAARPTALACFAAECALALTSACALVASTVASSTGTATPEAADATGPAVTPLCAATTAVGGGHTDEGSRGERGVEAVPVGKADEIYRDSGSGETSPAGQTSLARSRGGPVRATAGEEEGGKKGVREEEKEQTRAAIVKEQEAEEEPHGRWRALRVLYELLPSSAIPLLVLAEAWLGGVAGGSGSVGAAGSASGGGNSGIYPRQPGSDGRGPGGVRAASRDENTYSGVSVSWDRRSGWSEAGRSASLSYGGVRGAVVGEGGRGLAATAVRDLVAVLVSAVDVARRLEEREAERRRVLERDGLEEGEMRGQKCHVALAAAVATRGF